MGISCYFWIIRVGNSHLVLYSCVRCNPLDTPNTPKTPSKYPLVPEERWLTYHYTKLGRWTYIGQWSPLGPEEIWLAYPYTKLGRWIYIGQWTPLGPEERWLAFHYIKVGRWTYFGWWTPHGTRGEMTYIPLHKTCQMNQCWPMHPPVPEERWLAYHYTKLGRWSYIGKWQPQYQSSDDFHTTAQNLADEPNLAEHNGKSLKALAFTISEILHCIFSKHLFAFIPFFHS